MGKLSSLVVLLLAVSLGSPAEVVEVNTSGFLVRREALVDATPEKVYRSLTADVGSWWHPEHTYSKNPRNLSIDARAGGCFCERLPDGGGAEHLRVVFVSPGKKLRMVGALGPLQQSGLAGSMTWTLTAQGSSTKVELTYDVGGRIAGGFDKIAPAVNSVLGEQLGRLERFIETGNPEEKK